MAEIDTYSPRKVTAQNRDRLPSDHDPKKRITYVNITLNEEEIAEAIRNWIRAQVPIPAKTEMPVEMIAGRSGNGHSANVTVPMTPVPVSSPERPTEPMQEFDAAAADARRRNQENGVNADETTDTPADTPDAGTNETSTEELVAEQENTQVEETASAETESVTVVATETEEGVVLKTEEEAAAEPLVTEEKPKKSSLFDAPAASSPLPAPDAAAAATPPEAAPETAETPAEKPTTEEAAPAPKSQVKSIFD